MNSYQGIKRGITYIFAVCSFIAIIGTIGLGNSVNAIGDYACGTYGADNYNQSCLDATVPAGTGSSTQEGSDQTTPTTSTETGTNTPSSSGQGNNNTPTEPSTADTRWYKGDWWFWLILIIAVLFVGGIISIIVLKKRREDNDR